jgi:hypothetical protein
LSVLAEAVVWIFGDASVKQSHAVAKFLEVRVRSGGGGGKQMADAAGAGEGLRIVGD